MTTGKGKYLHRKKKMARNSILVPFLIDFILFQSNIAKAAGQYRPEGKKSSWQEANMTCDLSTPDIQFENEEILIKPNPTISSLLNKGIEAWVGYVKDFIYTELKGCMKDEDMSMDNQPNVTEPYQCTYVCIHTSFFGLTKTEENSGCICLNDTKKNLLQQGCTIKCDETDLLCGSEKSLAIYENEPHGQRASTVRQYGYVYNSGNKLYLRFANSTETKPKAICDTEKLSPETLPKVTKAGTKLTKGTAATGATLTTLPLNATTKTKTIATITAMTTKSTTGTKSWTTTTAATTTGSIGTAAITTGIAATITTGTAATVTTGIAATTTTDIAAATLTKTISTKAATTTKTSAATLTRTTGSKSAATITVTAAAKLTTTTGIKVTLTTTSSAAVTTTTADTKEATTKATTSDPAPPATRATTTRTANAKAAKTKTKTTTIIKAETPKITTGSSANTAITTFTTGPPLTAAAATMLQPVINKIPSSPQTAATKSSKAKTSFVFNPTTIPVTHDNVDSSIQSNTVTNAGQYRLETEKSSWQDAKDYCDLSIPDIQFEKEKIIIKPSAAISSLLKEGEEAWIGYVKDFIYVELKGCTIYNDEPIIIEPNITKPYQCAYVCRHARFFGLRMFKGNMRCICLNNTSNNLLEDHCTITCHGSDLLCGRRKRYAIYEGVSNEEKLTGVVYKNWREPSAKCLANHKFFYRWENCSVPLRPICSKVGFPPIALKPSRKWYEAALNCLKRNHSIQPYTKNVIHVNTRTNEYLWTANTRFMHVFGDNERYRQKASTVRQYGYVFKSNNTLYLRFADSTETKRKAVCDEVIPPKPVTNVTTQITTAETTVIAAETTEEGTRTTNLSSSPKSSNGHSNSVTMIMLLIVVLVILPAVAGSVWFIMKWKYGRNSKPGDKEEIPLDNQFVKTAQEPEEDVEYEEIDFDYLIGNTCNQAVASIQVNVETEIRDNLNYTDLTCGEGNASVNYFIPEKNKPTDKDDTKMAGMSNVTCGERNVSANSFILEKNKLAKGGDTKIAGMSNVIWIEGNAAANDFIPEKNEPANGIDTKMAGMSSVTNGERNVSASANYFILEKNELTNEDRMELAAKSCIDVTSSQLHIYDKTGEWNSNEHYDVIGKINKITLDEQQNPYDTTKNVALRYNSENRTKAMTDAVKDKVDNSDYNEVDITYDKGNPKGAGQELSDSGDIEDIVQATHNMQTDL